MDKQASRRPDYIGIGFRRCASSWLHQCLYEHPELGHYRGESASGAHFFSSDEKCRRGIQWYEELFGPYEHRKVVGEFSVSYTYPEKVHQTAARISESYPEAKLLCIVRNPVDRAYSDYLRSVLGGELDKGVSFEKAIELDPRLVQRGYYGRILAAYGPYLDWGRLLVLVYEHLQSDPAQVTSQLYAYLGVDPGYTPSVLSEQKGHAYIPRSQKTQEAIVAAQRITSRLFHKLRGGIVLDALRELGVQQAIRNLNRLEKPLAPDIRRRLGQLYRADIDDLSDMVGKDLSVWQEAVD